MPNRSRSEIALAALMIATVPVTCTPRYADCVIKCGDHGSCPNGLSCSNGFCTNHGICGNGSAEPGADTDARVPDSGARSGGAGGATQADGGREAGAPSGGRGNRDPTPSSGGTGGTRPDASLDSSVDDGSVPFDAADAHAEHDTGRDASLDAADSSTERPKDYRYTDRTGTITINVRTCAPVAVTGDVEANCYPPDDFVLVGGGAELLDNPQDPVKGAVLSRSAPGSGCLYWAASWIDGNPEHHPMGRAYSIGIRLESRARPGTYIKADELAAVRSCNSHKYLADGSTHYSDQLPDGHLLVGGGAANSLFPPPVALVESYPVDQNWSAKGVSIDAQQPNPEFRIFAIGLPSSIVDFGSINTQLVQSVVSCGTSHVCTSTNPLASVGGVVTSVGGMARYAGSGRFLSALLPLVETNAQFTAGVEIKTRDFFSSDTSAEDPSVRNQSALLILSKSN